MQKLQVCKSKGSETHFNRFDSPGIKKKTINPTNVQTIVARTQFYSKFFRIVIHLNRVAAFALSPRSLWVVSLTDGRTKPVIFQKRDNYSALDN